MAEKPHLLFQNPRLPAARFRYKSRFPGLDQDEERAPDYMPLAADYQSALTKYATDAALRVSQRTIQVPANILYLEIDFFGWFDGKNFENHYRNNFGLSPLKYLEYNTKGIFAITSADRFGYFVDQLNLFIATQDHLNPEYDTRLKYIKSFKLLTSDQIIHSFSEADLVTYLNLVDYHELNEFDAIKDALRVYLEDKNIRFVDNESNQTIEILNPTAAIVLDIVRNFDILHSVNSGSFGVIRPTRVGVPERSFPFTVANPGNESTIIGIIDTGVSEQTPLSTLLINNNNDFDLTGGNGKVDDVDHGTAVAAFSALGQRIIGNVNGELFADARILSIKVLSAERGTISVLDIERLIRNARAQHNVRLFVLTVNFSRHLNTDSAISSYAYLLDKISYELDILIFISTANYRRPDGHIFDLNDCQNYPNQFLAEESNMCPPAESMNNLTVGAVGSNFEADAIDTITENSYPTIYSRTYHINYESLFQKNNKLVKPDIVYPGGNYVHAGNWPDPEGTGGMQYLSSVTGQFFLRSVGTSFSTPLIANIAAKILNKYPSLQLQTIKALIINGSSEIRFGPEFDNFTLAQKRFACGHGVPNEIKCLSSNENEVTLVIESTISSGSVESYLLRIPEYLNAAQKNIGLLEITATLCFSFRPLQNNHIAYCPVHISFGVFKNIPLTNSQNVLENNSTILVKDGWSQDGYYKSKLYSNVQKVRFTISRDEILDEENRVKIAINSKFHSILSQNIIAQLETEYDFSLVIRIKEQQREHMLTGQLYDEIQLVNNLEVLGELDIEVEGEAEAEL